MKKHPFYNKGFALLFTVLVISLILTIALSISNIAYKQSILSNLARDSQIAFYEADSAAECLLYYDIAVDFSEMGELEPQNVGALTCGSSRFSVDLGSSRQGYYLFKEDNTSPTMPCANVLISIDDPIRNKTIIEARGYNLCGESPRKVERAIEVEY